MSQQKPSAIEISTEKSLQTACHEATSDLDQLAIVLAWFNQLYGRSIPQALWFQGQLAIAEGLTSAVRHAHKLLLCPTPIDIQLLRFNGAIDIQRCDQEHKI